MDYGKVYLFPSNHDWDIDWRLLLELGDGINEALTVW
jgi:hypothetical protein